MMILASLPVLPVEDWASKRVGFAQADHSQDGEAQGAIGSPEARPPKNAGNDCSGFAVAARRAPWLQEHL